MPYIHNAISTCILDLEQLAKHFNVIEKNPQIRRCIIFNVTVFIQAASYP